jgi:hypothetical protein
MHDPLAPELLRMRREQLRDVSAQLEAAPRVARGGWMRVPARSRHGLRARRVAAAGLPCTDC